MKGGSASTWARIVLVGYRLLPMILCCWLVSFPAAADKLALEVKFSGVGSSTRNNVRSWLPPLPQRESQLRWYTRRAVEAAERALRTEGYYQAQIQPELTQQDNGWVLRLRITRGPPAILREVSVTLLGDGQGDPQMLEIRDESPLRKGSQVNHGQYQALKDSFSRVALQRGYFDARWEQSQILIEPDRVTARLVMVYDTGKRYRYGSIDFGDVPLTDGLLQRFLSFGPGDAYDAAVLAETQSNLFASGYFDEVSVVPDLGRSDSQLLPLDISLTMTDPNEFNTGVGYTTDLGPRIQLQYNKPWLNRYGHGLSSRAALSFPRQSLNLAYEIPLFRPPGDILQLNAGYLHEDIRNINTERVTAGVKRDWYLGKTWRPTVSLDYNKERFKESSDESFLNRRRTEFLVLGLGISRLYLDRNLFPEQGDRLLTTIEGADPALLSDISMLRLYGIGRYLTTLDNVHRIFARLEGGVIMGDGILDIPPSYRFYAGGDNSIRGYAYKSLGPRIDGNLVGGKKLLVGSVQYGYPLWENWHPIVFTDAGAAWNSNFEEQFTWSAGVGIRWLSPLGGLRLYLAYGIRGNSIDNKGNPIRFHFTMGPEV